jgi:hypothetical protein
MRSVLDNYFVPSRRWAVARCQWSCWCRCFLHATFSNCQLSMLWLREEALPGPNNLASRTP